ncbi:MAG TPA: winged helix-turn-helix domain-containing protein [Pseudolysinimonas sp.]|jgi:DNA-binding transcriptional ArsR family regulator
MTDQPRESSAPAHRDLDLESLKALSHPLRVQLLDALSVYGPATASGLGERLGESSGATSYHLRQLEKHGLVREQEGRGSGRERWWERTPGSINIGSPEAVKTPAGRSAATVIYREMQRAQRRLIDDYAEHGSELLSAEWQEAGDLLSSNTRLTPEQLRAFVAAVHAVLAEYVTPFRSQDVPGARPVHVEFNAFPVLDAGLETPGEPS